MIRAFCRIEMLGGLRAVLPERVVSRFVTRKTAGLLAYLAFHLGQEHPREILVELLWPDADPAAGRQSLSQAVTSLRRQLEPPGVAAGVVLRATRAALSLNPDAVRTDVGEFEEALVGVEAPDGQEPEQALAAAVALYHGPLLPDDYSDWVIPERERLAERHLHALLRLARCREDAGDHAAAVDLALRAVAASPLDEEASRCLIALYAAAGQSGKALAEYRRLEGALREELDAPPSEATRALIASMGNGRSSVAAGTQANRRPAGAAPAAAGVGAPGTAEPQRPLAAAIPMRWTRFFGRQEELANLCELLAPGGGLPGMPRLVTLTGPAGCGKSRLAAEAASVLADAYSGAAWYVPLVGLADPGHIPAAAASAMGLPRSPRQEPLDQVASELGRRPSLLVLDNFEHLVDGGAELLSALLQRAPSTACLVTSRRLLNLSAEREFTVGALPLPAVGDPPDVLVVCPSVQLFVDRAQAVRPDFQVTERNARSLAELCVRLEGIPLAVELAAARAQVLAPSQMLAGLARRFDLLVARRRDADPRHQSMEAAVDWSYRLLRPDLQRLFARLSVFRGGWTEEAAAEVSEQPGVLDGLAQLREASLVSAEERDGVLRFGMLETLREYAWERLSDAEQDAVRRRHAIFFARLGAAATGDAATPRQAETYRRLETEQNNLRTALRRFLEAEDGAEPGLSLAADLRPFWGTYGHITEGRRHLASALARADHAAPTAALARALGAAGVLAAQQGDVSAARGLLEGALAANRALNRRDGEALSLMNLGNVVEMEGDAAASRALIEQARAIYADLGDRAALARCLINLASAAMAQADYAGARQLLEQALPIHRAAGDRQGEGNVLCNLGALAGRQRDYASARHYLEQALALDRETGDRAGQADTLQNLGNTAERQGDLASARALYDEALLLNRDMGNPDRAAVTLRSLAGIARKQGDYTRAETLGREALRLRCRPGEQREVCWHLEALAMTAAARGEANRAARLVGAAAAMREAERSVRSPDWQQELKAGIAPAREALGDEAFAAAQTEGRRMSRDQAIALALGGTA